MIDFLNSLIDSKRSFIVTVIVFAMVIEIITCLGRFGFKISMKEHESTVKKNTFGVRIHHGYIGAFLLLAAYAMTHLNILKDFDFRLVYVAGWALLISDIIHHFIVLYLITGKTEFP